MNNILLVFPYNVTNLKDFEEIVNKFESENFIIHYFEGINNENLFVDGLLYLVDNIKKSYSDINKIVILSNLRELIFSWYRCFNGLVDDYIYYIDSNNMFFLKKDEYYQFFKNLSNFKSIEAERLEGKIYININDFNYKYVYDFLLTNLNLRYFKDYKEFDFDKISQKSIGAKKYFFNRTEYYFGSRDNDSPVYHIDSNQTLVKTFDINLINNVIENIYFVKYLLIEMYKMPQRLDVNSYLVTLFKKLGEDLSLRERENILDDIINYLNKEKIDFKEKIYHLSLSVLLKSERDLVARNIMSTLLEDTENIENHYAVLYNTLFYEKHSNMKIYDEIYLQRRNEILKLADYFKKKGNIKIKASKKESYEKITEKKKLKIAIHDDQLLSINHSPTKLCLDLAKNFKKHYPEFKIKIFIEDNLIISEKEVIHPYHFSSSASSHFREEHKEYLKGYNIDIFYSMPNKNKIDRTGEFINEIIKYNPDVIYTTSDLSISKKILYSYYPIITSSLGGLPTSTPSHIYALYENIKINLMKINLIYNLVCEKNIFLLNNAVEFEEPRAIKKKKDYLLDDLDFVLVTVGNRLDVEIDDLFLDVICSFIKENSNVKWLVIGPKNSPTLEKKYKELILTQKIIQIGFENDLMALYTICDIYVNPFRDGGGISIAMAMSSRVPIITMKESQDAAYWVGESNCVESIEDYSKELIKIYSNHEYAINKGFLMRKRVESFSYSNYLDNILDLIKEAKREFYIDSIQANSKQT